MAGRMAQVKGAAAAGSRETTPAAESENGSETSNKRRDASVDHGLQLELDDVFKLMDYLEKEGLQILSTDMESKAIATMKAIDVKPVPRVDSEAGVLSRVRSNDSTLCPPKLDLSKSRFNLNSRTA
jgi:hypothetical protein